MPPDSPDSERLRRLREQQLTSRDPMRKQRKLHQTISQRHLKAREPFSIGRIWAGIPNRWRGLFFGALLGAGLLLVVPALVQIDLVTGCVVLAVPFLMVLGFAIGKGIDSRKELEDLIH